MGDITFSVDEQGQGSWRVRAEVSADGQTASGAYLTGERPAGERPAHAGLAAALAWRALGERQLEAGRADAALACARRGLEALGDDYAPRTANDDTELKIAAAEGLIEDGEAANAAGTLLRALDSRTRLYQQRYELEAA